MTRSTAILTLAVVALLTAGCGAAATPTPDASAIETRIAARIFATQTASVPTPTVTPQVTPQTTAPKLTIPPRGTFDHKFTITEEYDKYKDWTVVRLLPQAGYWGGVNNLFVYYTYSGIVPAIPAYVTFSLLSRSDTWLYLKCYDLSLLLDRETRLNPKTTHEGSVESGYVLEYIVSQMPVETFLQIAGATRVEGKLCNAEFLLGDNQIQALRDLASRMNPK